MACKLLDYNILYVIFAYVTLQNMLKYYKIFDSNSFLNFFNFIQRTISFTHAIIEYL